MQQPTSSIAAAAAAARYYVVDDGMKDDVDHVEYYPAGRQREREGKKLMESKVKGGRVCDGKRKR